MCGPVNRRDRSLPQLLKQICTHELSIFGRRHSKNNQAFTRTMLRLRSRLRVLAHRAPHDRPRHRKSLHLSPTALMHARLTCCPNRILVSSRTCEKQPRTLVRLEQAVYEVGRIVVAAARVAKCAVVVNGEGECE